MARVTNAMLSSNYLTNMNRNLRNMQVLQSQLASGKAINKPSDDPYKASRTMQLYSEIDSNKQFNENIKDISNWLDTTDTALNQAGNVFGRIRTLLMTAGNGAYGEDERKAIQDEVKEKVNELAQILNTNFDGAYIFGGTKSTSKPVTVDTDGKIKYADKDGNATTDATTINQIGSGLNVEVSEGVLIKYNKTAVDILQYKDKSGASQNVSDLLEAIEKNLDTPATTTASFPGTPGQEMLTGTLLGQVDSVIQNLLQRRSEVGAMTNRMESAQSKNEDENLDMTDILSKTEDIDFTEKMMSYSMMQTVYMASLQTSAKILPTSLLDYIR
ncbi:flagellar hook-associated protein FlgL [Clostridium beijerinckii]|uniref:flagellar hook-associated protein FlgL n=1 Tax=Clostridium beijerinckii TaxID=1520 RepID=UPI0009D09BFD|nr:flagellar hook-associated protein FlgL [Clostridium beijerinckii]MBA8933019.1 flagellar hook-associated protein 3 FlgL [Clostridium beijerinckii]NRT37033.1 flagellar hook-associated protein 3 FlgL [Clostridium beijerinckii]NRT43533.1 flagellar hook-associated protein 3 FlgL [Clostridium beijerinckii]NRT79368.1 flagellar hook-associated protein 3 FlgL [Clostridium beijerinckii]NRU37222.1 flagellar hook-associated protein 3 FlgL [Clostridium beijerinckii]